MNKLKRANQTIVTTTEPTKASAVTSHRSSASKIVATTSTVHPPSNEFDKTPRNAVEQYWAARALTAEALLKARTEHHRDLRAMTYSEDMKRERDRSSLVRANEEKLARMERLTWAMFMTIIFLCLLVVYASLRTNQQKQKEHWFLPSHFTIPILSPFTSVVEQEASMIGSKIIIPTVLILACLVYGVYRHWSVHGFRKS